jgi:hypothetical protein
MHEKSRCSCPGGPTLKQFIPAQAGCGPDFTSWEAQARGVTAFEGAIRKYAKVLAVLSLGLRHALMTLALPTFLVRMSF